MFKFQYKVFFPLSQRMFYNLFQAFLSVVSNLTSNYLATSLLCIWYVFLLGLIHTVRLN